VTAAGVRAVTHHRPPHHGPAPSLTSTTATTGPSSWPNPAVPPPSNATSRTAGHRRRVPRSRPRPHPHRGPRPTALESTTVTGHCRPADPLPRIRHPPGPPPPRPAPQTRRGHDRRAEGCCGLAGDVCFEAQHYGTSLAVADLALTPRLDATTTLHPPSWWRTASAARPGSTTLTEGRAIHALHLEELLDPAPKRRAEATAAESGCTDDRP
jgi:hypothetical protein